MKGGLVHFCSKEDDRIQSRADVRFVIKLNILCMHAPTLSTRTTNVELTKQRRTLLIHTLSPLGRFNGQPGDIHFDVVVRQESAQGENSKYFLSVKCQTAHSSYMTVAIASRFEKAVKQASVSLKRQLQETTYQEYRRRRAESVWRHDLHWA